MLRHQFGNAPASAERKIARAKRNLQTRLFLSRDEHRSCIQQQPLQPSNDHRKLSANIKQPNLFREFLELILQDEMHVRHERLMQRHLKLASFREQKTLDDFDWRFNPSIKRKPICDLAACHFIRERKDVLLIGPPGVGKSHLAQAIGYEAIKAGFLVLYRSIFDLVRDFLRDEAVGTGREGDGPRRRCRRSR